MQEIQQDKPWNNTQNKQLENASGKPSEKPSEDPSVKPSEDLSEKPSEEPSEKTTKKPSENLSEKPSENPLENSSTKSSKKRKKKSKGKSKQKKKEKQKQKKKQKSASKSAETSKNKKELSKEGDQSPLAKADIAMMAEFENWCIDTLSSWAVKVDIHTFYSFLKDIEAPYEVKEYVKYYLGDSKKTKEFARHFVERRSELLRASMAVPSDDLAKPAAAVNPRLVSKSDYQEPKKKNKKSKKKMLVGDSSVRGLTVPGARDQINNISEDSVRGPPQSQKPLENSKPVTPPKGDTLTSTKQN